MSADDAPSTKCHHCGVELPLRGRGVRAIYPQCGAVECRRAAKRRYQAEFNVGRRVRSAAERLDEDQRAAVEQLTRRVEQLSEHLASVTADNAALRKRHDRIRQLLEKEE